MDQTGIQKSYESSRPTISVNERMSLQQISQKENYLPTNKPSKLVIYSKYPR
jgi:hypothetical protein